MVTQGFQCEQDKSMEKLSGLFNTRLILSFIPLTKFNWRDNLHVNEPVALNAIYRST